MSMLEQDTETVQTQMEDSSTIQSKGVPRWLIGIVLAQFAFIVLLVILLALPKSLFH